ncbi:MAG: alpha/beta hydrolase [Verrucomicrobiae bacterium]|nr:alpha/beta hydrolase [Verrucomicrobiae bacterium]
MHRLVFLILSAASLLRAEPGASSRALSDVPYKTGDSLSDYERERCKLDVYLPESGKDWPVLVWFHGGGLKAGDKRGTPEDGVKTEPIVASLSRAGIAVVSVNYRFSPKVTFPAYLEDAAAAVAWAKGHLKELGANPDRLYVGGHSAGGYVAFMIGLDPTYLLKEGLSPKDLAGLIPVSGQTVTHSTVREERGIARTTVISDEAAPLYHVRKDTPPILVIYADRDMAGREAENELFVEMMKSAKNEGVTGLRVEDRTHGSIASEIANEGDPAREAILRFVGVSSGPTLE